MEGAPLRLPCHLHDGGGGGVAPHRAVRRALTLDAAPLIVTCGLDEESFRFFDGLRRAHFPRERNHLPAHLTLFHHLPGDRAEEVAEVLAPAAAATPAPVLRVTGLRKLGQGVAFTVASEELQAVRRAIAAHFAAALTAQDRQGFRPHVTVQNKVAPAEAAALYDALCARFTPFEARATSLLLWRYHGGPWEAAGAFPFAAS